VINFVCPQTGGDHANIWEISKKTGLPFQKTSGTIPNRINTNANRIPHWFIPSAYAAYPDIITGTQSAKRKKRNQAFLKRRKNSQTNQPSKQTDR